MRATTNVSNNALPTINTTEVADGITRVVGGFGITCIGLIGLWGMASFLVASTRAGGLIRVAGGWFGAIGY